MQSAVRDVLLRANEDYGFRAAILDGDLQVLTSYDLTEWERAALSSGDESELYKLLGETKYFHIREQGNYEADD